MTPARVERIAFASKEDKARYMASQAHRDAGLPEVQRWASVFRSLPLEQRAPAILRFVQYCLDYTRDPGAEELADAEISLGRGWGDCDDKDRIFRALCEACGLATMIRPIFDGDAFPHVASSVYTNGQWQPVDATIQNSAIGAIPPYRLAQTNYW